MIITTTPEKDTYITNLKTRTNDASFANTGIAATLDLFKLYNENKYAFSKLYLKLDLTKQKANLNNLEITLKDYKNSELTIKFNNTINYENSNFENNVYVLGILNKQLDEVLFLLNEKINLFQEDKIIDIKSFYNNEILILKQNQYGIVGDTQLIFSDEDQDIFLSLVDNNFSFCRIDYSAILIKFDIDKIKNEWIKISNDIIDTNSIFNNLQAKLILKDVTMGNTKPFDYELSVYELKKNFIEGKGKDTINFSDNDVCNFIKINKNETWQIEEFFKSNDDIELVELSTSSNFITGGEDLNLDITDYLLDKILNGNDKGLILTFSDGYLFNNKTYFVKRFGSRHLLNKILMPTLELHVDETQNFINYFNNDERFFDKDEIFYIFNINIPDGYDLKYRFLKNKDDILNEIAPLKTGVISEALYDIKGNIVDNSYKFTESLSFKDIKLTKTNIYLDYFIENNDEEILLQQIKYTYLNSFSVNETLNQKENCILKFDHDLYANDSLYNLTLHIQDTSKIYGAVKLPYELRSEYYGDIIYYKIIDADTNKILIDYNDFSTKLKWTGKNYIASIFIPELYKHKRIKLEFKIKEKNSSHERFILNEKQIFKVN